jgi:hypothetical protein
MYFKLLKKASLNKLQIRWLHISEIVALAFFLVILDIFLWLLLVLHANFVPPLDVHQSLISCAKLLADSVNTWLWLSML